MRHTRGKDVIFKISKKTQKFRQELSPGRNARAETNISTEIQLEQNFPIKIKFLPRYCFGMRFSQRYASYRSFFNEANSRGVPSLPHPYYSPRPDIYAHIQIGINFVIHSPCFSATCLRSMSTGKGPRHLFRTRG